MKKQLKDFCEMLCHAQTEDNVTDIIGKMESCFHVGWKPYGGTTGNYSSFENQQTTAEGALMEKIVNSIDHKLIRQCRAKGINPSSDSAPQSMQEAKRVLFTQEELEKEIIWVLADGSKKEMNVTVADDGEGQAPERFEQTLLSLQSGNKNNVPFVQGKFNMGSTGAAVFCGNHKYQLIMSRENRVLTGKEGQIGFTIVRKHKRTEDEQRILKSTWYEYMTINGEIPAFHADKIVLCQDFNERYTYRDGTVVKMYNYQLKNKGQAFQTLKATVNSLLYETAFPIAIHESRRSFERVKERNGITNISKGCLHLLTSKEDKNIEFKSENNLITGASFGKVSISMYVYSSKIDTNTLNGVGLRTPVVFLMNGQVQYSFGVPYVTSQLGFKLIKKHLFVVVDCSELSKDFQDDGFFMANRETIRQSENSKHLIDTITKYLKNEQNLIRLNKERAAQQVSSKGTQEIFEKLLGRSQKGDFLESMFKIDDYGTQSSKQKKTNKNKHNDDALVLNKFPTYVKMKGEEANNTKNVHVEKGKGFTVTMELDAEDDYFSRSIDKGEFRIQCTAPSKERKTGMEQSHGGESGGSSNIGDGNNKYWFDLVRSSLKDGKFKLTFITKEQQVEVGEKYTISIDIEDKNEVFNKNVLVTIQEPKQDGKGKASKNEKKRLVLPSVVLVYKDQSKIDTLNKSPEEKSSYKVWQDVEGWGENSSKQVVKIMPSSDENEIASAIYINMSCDSLARIIHEEGTAGTKIEFSQEQFMTSIYSNSFLILGALNSLKKKNVASMKTLSELDGIEEFVEDLVKELAYAAVKMQINNVVSSQDKI